MARAPKRPVGADPVEWVREHWEQREYPEPERFAAAASLMRAHQVVVGALELALRPFELSRSMYLTLVTLALSEYGERRLSYLSRYLMVHPSTITLIVDQLAARGLVGREPHPTDRRASVAVLTADGRTLVERATAAAAGVGFGMADVDPETLERLTESLRSVRRAAGDL